MQFNLRFLFAAVAAVAIGTYALIYATTFWAVLAYTLCVILFFSAIVLAAAARERPRFFWFGFALFGWGYLIVLHSPIFHRAADQQKGWMVFYEGPPLPSRAFARWMYREGLAHIHKPPVWDQSQRYTTNGSQYPTEMNFCQVCHSEFALLFALLGGVIGSLAHFRYRGQPIRNSDAS
jgi:hypothetical protein